jgi:hypothetical protein
MVQLNVPEDGLGISRGFLQIGADKGKSKAFATDTRFNSLVSFQIRVNPRKSAAKSSFL